MAEVKNKIVTVESLSTLHEYNKDIYMPMVDPTGSGTMTFDGDIEVNSITVSNKIVSNSCEINSELMSNNLFVSSDADIGGDLKVGGDIIDDLKVSGNVIVKNINNGLYGVHHITEQPSCMVHMNPYGNTVIGYDGYANKNANSFVCGQDVEHHIASANNTHYRPYYRAGDVINFNVRTSGYVTNMGEDVFFTIPITKPVIGNPLAMAESEKGFILRQRGAYTHGCKGDVVPAIYAKPRSYTVDKNYNGGFVITASFENLTGSFNNDTIGIYWDGKITLYYPEET